MTKKAPTTAPATLSVKLFSPAARLPTRAHTTDAGVDLYATANARIEPGSFGVISTDVGVALPEGTYGQILARSSYAVRGIGTLGGVVDSGYRGPVKVGIFNVSANPLIVSVGEKIAQLVVIQIAVLEPQEVEELPAGDRGANGFGSSGA